MRVALFDYGAGNLHSLAKALERHGYPPDITGAWDRALEADALVLPGVGAFGAAARALDGHADRVRARLDGGLPCLGICLGMQLLFDRSEEAGGRGVGLIPGAVRRLSARVVPQMGWNDVTPAAPDPLFPDAGGLVAYYANSFVCDPDDRSAVLAWTEYDGRRFPAAVRAGRTWGVQFHPEKSSEAGVALIGRFLAEAAS